MLFPMNGITSVSLISAHVIGQSTINTLKANRQLLFRSHKFLPRDERLDKKF